MEITILKCDRCKREVAGLIEFSFINRNIQSKDDDKTERELLDTLWRLKSKKDYPIVQGGLCLDCVMEISRWLGHPENILSGRI